MTSDGNDMKNDGQFLLCSPCLVASVFFVQCDIKATYNTARGGLAAGVSGCL